MSVYSELALWAGGVWKDEHLLPEDLSSFSLCHDTRTLQAGDFYIAIKGAIHDGHDFVEQAIQKGAAGVIVDAGVSCGQDVPRLVVSDTMEALWGIAAGVRSGWNGVVIGITGSAGKTTVKELVATVLSGKGTVAKTMGNWNNDVGLPLSMIAADRHADFFVFELGMNHPGEIETLAGLLKPDWAVVTNVGKAHIEFFESEEAIADEKASILKHASKAILDPGENHFERLSAAFDGEPVLLTMDSFETNVPGDHMKLNARFAATIGLMAGMSGEEVQQGLNQFRPAPMRWQSMDCNGATLINDAYNANPLSMRAALFAFSEMECEGRKFAVLGGMLELGDCTDEEHRLLGVFVDGLSFDTVITIGDLGAQIICRSVSGLNKEAATELLSEDLRPGDLVLFKASRGERLETMIEELNTKK